jgi:hypothetical protein
MLLHSVESERAAQLMNTKSPGARRRASYSLKKLSAVPFAAFHIGRAAVTSYLSS